MHETTTYRWHTHHAAGMVVIVNAALCQGASCLPIKYAYQLRAQLLGHASTADKPAVQQCAQDADQHGVSRIR